MNYEFHVGDYVENRKGDVGWITSITNEKVVWETNNGKTYVMEVLTLNRVQYPEALFVRIGAYDFTKEEKKNISLIEEDDKSIFASAIKPNNQLAQMVCNGVIDKINELVDAVNKLMDKEDDG
nr:MAG TPA: hypothetical protein [Caudoviricetes sp.]